MSSLFSNPWQSFVKAVAKSLSNNWFLKGQDGPSGGSEGTRIGDPYAESSWVFAACGLIAQPLASARLSLKDYEGAEIDDRFLHGFWEAPARTAHEDMSLDAMTELSVGVRGIAGGVFWVMDDSWLNRSASLYNKIIVAAPSQMMPIWDGRVLNGWSYRDGSGKLIPLLKEQVLHLKLPNPGNLDSLDGIPPWTPARDAAEAATAGARYAKRTMDKNGDMGSTIIVKSGITPDQREMLKAEIREKRRAASRGEYRDSVIGGDIEVVTPTMSAVSRDFAGQIGLSREEIFVAYQVPPSMGTTVASYSVGAASDWYRLINGPCLREARAFAAAISTVSNYLMGYRSLSAEIAGNAGVGRRGKEDRTVTAEFDFSTHPVMAEIRASRTETVERLFKIGVPVQVSNDFLQLGIPEYKGWEVGYLPFSLAPVGSQESLVSGPLSEEKSLSAPLDEAAELVRQWGATRTRTIEKKQSAERAALWAKIDRARTGNRKRVKNAFSNQLMKARAETLANLKANREALEKAMLPDAVGKAGAIDIIFNLFEWSRGLVGTMRSILGGIFVEAANDVADEVPGDYDPMTDADPRVIAYLRDRENMMKGVADEIHQEMLASLEEGISAGETFEELEKRVRAIFNDMSKVRAETIARTETGAAYETARYHSLKAAGVQRKGWLSGGDDGVTRATHQAADGQVRGIDEFFEVGEARLQHPADHVHGAAYPGELINCRCVLVAEG